MILTAQAVPSAALLPCVAALPSGWQVGGADIASGTARLMAGLGSRGPASGHRNPHRGLRHHRRPADPLGPARHPAVRTSAQPGAPILQPPLLHLPRRLRHLRVPLPARSLPGAGRRRRQRAGVPAPVGAHRLGPACRGPDSVRTGCRVPRVSRQAAPSAGAGTAGGARKLGRWLTGWWFRAPDGRVYQRRRADVLLAAAGLGVVIVCGVLVANRLVVGPDVALFHRDQSLARLALSPDVGRPVVGSDRGASAAGCRSRAAEKIPPGRCPGGGDAAEGIAGGRGQDVRAASQARGRQCRT